MDARTPRFSTRVPHCLVAAALLAAVGCTPSKTVTLRTTSQNGTPLDGGTVMVYRVAATGTETRVPLTAEESRTPATLKLEFLPDEHYRVEAHRVLCSPSHETVVRQEPEDVTDYAIKLTQFKHFVDGLVYAPARSGDLWRLRASPTRTTATIDVTEPNPVYIDQPVPVTDNQRPDVDFPSFAVAAGAGGTVMVYEQSQRDTGIPGGLDSRLFKLPLGPGAAAGTMAPTTLTTNRKQQHNPAFTYSGEDVIFDTDDDSRTRSPAQFPLELNEAQLRFLEHDADTCETQFSAGRDALAFTAYAPNAAGPQVMVSSLDGSGPTPRGRGMYPQIKPDGNRIVFVHRPENGGHLRLATVNVRGPISTEELQLDADHDAAEPHWSPDGKLIAYCSDLRDARPVDEAKEPDPAFREPDDTHSFLWVVSADGRTAIQLTHNESFDSCPTFDPNGRTIYFRSNRGGTWNIWKCNLSDAAMAKLGVH
jgi:Tol biopolymer transport system component